MSQKIADEEEECLEESDGKIDLLEDPSKR